MSRKRNRHTIGAKDGTGHVIDKVQKSVELRKTPVCWGIPMDELGFSRFWANWLRHSNVMPWDGYITTMSTYLPDARNTIHENFVKNSDLPYLMMVDSDILFPPNMVETLMKHKLPIVGGWYKNKTYQTPVVYDFVSTSENGVNNFKSREFPGKGLEKVDGMGAGCWLMTRETAIKVGERPYDMNVGGEDLFFCKKLMDAGIPLHVDWDLPMAHAGVFYV